MNGRLLENCNIKALTAPVDGVAAVTGARVSMGLNHKVAAVFNFGASIADANVKIALQQHNAATAGTSKDLSIIPAIYKKIGAATVFTKVELTAVTALIDLSADLVRDGGIVVVEVECDQLDGDNNFAYMSMNLEAAGVAKLVSAEYICAEPRFLPGYSQAI